VRQDLGEALRWWKEAAAGGEAAAHYRLGLAYATGGEVRLAAGLEHAGAVEVDEHAAFRHFRIAAEQAALAQQEQPAAAEPGGGGGGGGGGGSNSSSSAELTRCLPEVHCWLGACYAQGRGCAKSEEDAYACFAAGAALGHPDAQYAVGVRLLNGQGVEVDKEVGAEWLQVAAQAGHARSQARLGWCVANGEAGAGVAPAQEGDRMAMAMRWWSMAAAQGEGLGLPLASYRLPESPAFQIDIALNHASAAHENLSRNEENKWHT
jgi:TPR repeat protein